MKGLTALPVKGIGFIEKGADLARLIVDACADSGITIQERDVLVVAQKAVSKAEGRVLDLKEVKVSARAKKIARRLNKEPDLTEAILQESRQVIKMGRGHLITEQKGGLIMANAGIDRSNVSFKEGLVSLLPLDPDGSAKRLRNRIKRLSGVKELAVIISDSVGRPFRKGSVGLAIGLAGIAPFRDYRGRKDLYGYSLKTSQQAVADELASVASLVMGQADEAIPAVIIRDFKYEPRSASAAELQRDKREDLFRRAPKYKGRSRGSPG